MGVLGDIVGAVGGPVVSAVGNIVGDVFSQSNARDAFQSRYQDTVKDMRAAGLNPALAYGQGGGNPQTMSYGDWGSSAASAAQALAQANATRAQTEKTKQETEVLKASAANLVERSGLINANLTSSGHLIDNTAALRGFEKDFARDTYTSRVATAKETAAQAALRTQLSRLSIPEARAYAKYYDSAVGRAEPYITTAKGVVGAITGAARDAADTRYKNSWRRR